jgi:hypothetical protein
MTNQTYKTPLFKELSDDALRTEYWGYRALAYNNANMAAGSKAWRDKCANQMGRLMRNIEIIEAIARKRKISLAK